jgi:2-dehydro-3-deoxygluconokinase
VREATASRVTSGDRPQRVVTFGELLLRLAAPGHARILQAESFGARYTGAEANVAVALACLGVECSVVSRVPSGDLGQACVNYIRRFGVDTADVRRGGSRLGLLYLETGAPPRASRVIYDRAGSGFATSTPSDYDWPAILEDAAWLHFSGTAPSGGDGVAAALAEGLAVARSRRVRVSCDLNFRSQLWSAEQARETLAPLMPYVDVLTGSGEDAAHVFRIPMAAGHVGATGVSLDGHRHIAAQLAERFGINEVAAMLRTGDGSASSRLMGVLTSRGATVTSSPHAPPTVVDRIGAGDAFSAGIIFGLLSRRDPAEAVELATRLYCIEQTIEGDFALVSSAELEALDAVTSATRVQR